MSTVHGLGEIVTVPTKVLELVERFGRNLDAYKQGKYNETQVCLELNFKFVVGHGK